MQTSNGANNASVISCKVTTSMSTRGGRKVGTRMECLACESGSSWFSYFFLREGGRRRDVVPGDSDCFITAGVRLLNSLF